MQIVTAGYGFDVPEIQNALIKTNYKSVEAAIEYLLDNQQKQQQKQQQQPSTSKPKQPSTSNNNNNNTVSEKDIQELKERIAKMEIEGNFKMNVTSDIMSNALKRNPNRPADALNYIMDTYSDLIQPNPPSASNTKINNKDDAQALKQKLIDDAMKKKEEQVKS